MVEAPDAACDRLKKLKLMLEDAKLRQDAAMIKKLTDLVGGQKPKYNLDKNHYLNVFDSQGNIGVLKLRHKAKKALDMVIEQLRANGVDPVSVNDGRIFVFTRSGMGNDTAFQVTVKQERVNHPDLGVVTRDIIHRMTESDLQRLDLEAAKLDQLFKKVTPEEIQRIVEKADVFTGKSPVIDELFDNSPTTDVVTSDEDDEDSIASGMVNNNLLSTQSQPVQQVIQPVQQAVQPVQQVTQPLQQAVQQAFQPAVQQVVQPVQQAPTQTLAQAPVPQSNIMSAPQTTATLVTEMTDDEFLKMLETPK
jgi:hypothetical protein